MQGRRYGQEPPGSGGPDLQDPAAGVGRAAGSFSVVASAAGIGPVSSFAEEPVIGGVVQAGIVSADSARMLKPSSAPPTSATSPAAVKLIGSTRPQADPVALVASRRDLRFDSLLVGGDLVVGQRHLRLQRVARSSGWRVLPDFTMVPETGSTQKVRWAA